MKNYLNFENEVKELENELDTLKDPYNKEGISEVNTQEILNFDSPGRTTMIGIKGEI